MLLQKVFDRFRLRADDATDPSTFLEELNGRCPGDLANGSHSLRPTVSCPV